MLVGADGQANEFIMDRAMSKDDCLLRAYEFKVLLPEADVYCEVSGELAI